MSLSKRNLTQLKEFPFKQRQYDTKQCEPLVPELKTISNKANLHISPNAKRPFPVPKTHAYIQLT